MSCRWRQRGRCLICLTLPLVVVNTAGQATGGWSGMATPQAWCMGAEEQYGRCSHLAECLDCQPEDCVFGAWMEWHARGACTGICLRSRTVVTPSNECGRACAGVVTQSKRCTAHYAQDGTTCIGPQADCEFGPWQAWTACRFNEALDQSYRHRSIRAYPLSGGAGCRGPTTETKSCGAPQHASDCVLTSWSAWSPCSRSCDGGHQSRNRDVFKHAVAGGELCRGSLRQTQRCREKLCDVDRDCILGTWSQWSVCGAPTALIVSASQRYRAREVLRPVQGHGDACRGATRETQTCGLIHPNVSCHVSDWTEWGECSTHCGGGQRYKHRHVRNPHEAAGCPHVGLANVEACNTEPCGVFDAGDCRLATWSVWSSCSAQCGIGAVVRSRDIAALAQFGKTACTAVLKETKPCMGRDAGCGKIDCAWGSWQEWSSCTCTCGGGEKRRNRIIDVSPMHGGKLCDVKDKGEIARCNSAPCNEECINGRWSTWTAWSDCSASCDFGARSRFRQVAQMPNACGLPNTGLDREVQKCKGIACHETEDCQFTDWNDWSYCSPACWGTRHRFREVANYALGTGSACEGSVENVQPCNPGPNDATPSSCKVVNDKTDCEVSFWSDWTSCTTTCGGGQQHRSRHITVLPSAKGLACNETLSMTKACATNACAVPRCRDCRWSPWSRWGSCSGCGGQKSRQRSIEDLPNFCGKRCNPSNGEETTKCAGECSATHFCSWSEWTAYTFCPIEGCGLHSQKRQRSLTLYSQPPPHNGGTYMAKGPRNIDCFGMESGHKPCIELRPCVLQEPRPCIFAAWADWDAPTCGGLCHRQRVIQQNSNLQKPCEGPLSDSKLCPKLCNPPADCELNDWKPWTMCIATHAQRYRSRRVIQYPLFGGKTCSGIHMTNETTGCAHLVVKQDCKLATWSVWSPCEKKCGVGGWQKRRRHIYAPAAGGGVPCTGNLEEMRGCNEFPCVGEEGCDLGQWGTWSHCRPYTAQKYRTREPNPSEVCRAHLEEIAPCEPMDCQLSAWGDWGECGASCGGSHHRRHRSVVEEAVRGGKPCTPDLSEVHPCGEEPCGPCEPQMQRCQTSLWTPWTPCSATCGSGHQTRERAVTQVRSVNGPGCNLPVNQNRMCHSHPCPSPDCRWSDWAMWSACSRTCGSGISLRKRTIANQPTEGGKPCEPVHTEEMLPCNVQKCTGGEACVPVDGEWADWNPWEFCTSSCRGGLSWRTRRNSKEMSSCGRPASGDDREYKNCNPDVPCGGDADCLLGEWEPWSDCSASCDGVASRSRRIVAMGRGRGEHCSGPVEETISCRPAPQDFTRPLACQAPTAADCVFAEWSTGPCTVSCGGGAAIISRHIEIPARGGGSPCVGPIIKTVPCGTKDCPGPQRVPCTWSDWDQWATCDHSIGQRKRFRHIAFMPHDGQICAAGDSEETEGCARSAGAYCGWSSWGSWGTCSRACKLGVRHRRRNLTELVTAPNPALHEVHGLPTAAPVSDPYDSAATTLAPNPCTTIAPKVAPTRSPTCAPTPHCMEKGGIDADCCAKPSLANCAQGFTYSRGALCWGTEFYHTCCSPSSTTEEPKRRTTVEGTTTREPRRKTSTKTFAMPVMKTTTQALKKDSDDFKPGNYVVNHPVALTIHMSTSSKMIKTLKANTKFSVVEVVTDAKEHRIRGRVMHTQEAPAGWISLKNLQTGHVWAHRAKDENQRKYALAELPSLRGLEGHRTRDLMVSFFCGLCSVLTVTMVVRRRNQDSPQTLSSPRDTYRAAPTSESGVLLRH